MIKIADRIVSFFSRDVIRAAGVLFFVFGAWIASASAAEAATLYFSPATGAYAVGKTFTINVMVSTPDQAANAYSGSISYPTDVLELTGLGKGSSVVSLWVQEPSFSGGRANFEGVTFNPGYKGGAGRIISLTFKAKAEGTGVVRFTSGSILANDGEGTNILTGLGTATFTIGDGGTPEPEKPPADVSGKPGTPNISSTTHSDSTKWYAANDATFKWGLGAGVDAVNILADQSENSDPGTSSDGLFSSYTYQDVKEGIWYIHLRVRNKNGWSPIAHFQFNIDSVKPDFFNITESPTSDESQPTRVFKFEATDSGSGIDHYDVSIDDGTSEAWVDDGSHLYRTQPTSPGTHALHVKAVDKAGNSIEDSASFSIQALSAPEITDYPKTASEGDTLVLKGRSYPNAVVTIWLQKDGNQPYSQQVTTDEEGKFTFVSEDDLVRGTYTAWATAADALGNVSEESEKITIRVKAPPFDVIGWITKTLAGMSWPILLNFLFLLALGYLLWRYLLLTKKLSKDVHGAQEALHAAFDLLKDDIQDQIKLLEKTKSKRELTLEEGKILKKLKTDLKAAEACIKKKIKQIEKNV
ncbi:MAG: Ig-like domain-containing protein [Patescibacteria group bacterium]|jgi:hypothetical protein